MKVKLEIDIKIEKHMKKYTTVEDITERLKDDLIVKTFRNGLFSNNLVASIKNVKELK